MKWPFGNRRVHIKEGGYVVNRTLPKCPECEKYRRMQEKADAYTRPQILADFQRHVQVTHGASGA